MIRRQLLIGTGLTAMGLGIAGCDYSSPPLAGFDPMMLQQSERNASRGRDTAELQSLPTTREDIATVAGATFKHNYSATAPSTAPSIDDEPSVRMTLQEIIHRSMMNNHDVKVAGYQPAIEGTRVIEAQAGFDPHFYSNIQYQVQNEQTAGQTFDTFTQPQQIFTAFQNQQDVATGQIGIKQNLPSGGQAQLQYQTQYSWFNPQRTVLNPFYESDLTLQVTQPLLRNFGYDVNQAQITINRDNQKESLMEFRKAVESNAADIEKTYWTLVQTLRTVEIFEDLVSETESTYSVLYSRWQKNLDVGQLQVSQALTRLDSRRAQLRKTKSDARDLSDKLKQLMSDPEFPVASNILVLPADAPIEDPMRFDVQDAVNSAMENRFELAEQQLKVDAATVTVTVAKNNLLPQVNFVGSVGAQGENGDWGKAFISNSNFNNIDFSIGLQIDVPIGNRAARAILHRTRLQEMQEVERYAALIQQVSYDVSTASRAVTTAWEQIVENRKSRFAAEDALNKILDRERANEPLRPEFVQLKLDTQDQLANALQSEAQAVAQYNIAIAQLEQAKGTLLKYNNVLMVEEQAKLTDRGLLR